MEMGVVIIGIILIAIIIVINVVDDIKKAEFDVGVFFGIVLSILTVIEIILLSSILENPKPTAMDVYRGKTTLEYTIRDSVKIDSVVVWKGDIDNED